MDNDKIYQSGLFSLSFQCSNDFLEMPEVKGGRFCSECNKCPVDFRGQSPKEINTYLNNNKGKKICGFFNPAQLQIPVTVIPEITTVPSIRRYFTLAMVTVTALTSCSTEQMSVTVQNINDQEKNISRDKKYADKKIDSKKSKSSFDKNFPGRSKSKKSIAQCVNHIDVIGGYVVEPVDPAEPVLGGDIVTAPEPFSNEPLAFAEEMPEFPGGTEKLHYYLKQNIIYPEQAKDEGLEGKAFIEFIIDTDGSVSDVKIVKSTSHIILDNEALRVVKKMPSWSPGKNQGRPVKVKMVVPIKFALK
jgi:periplasmic protein TonB